FISEFNLLGILSGKLKDRIETIKTLSNETEQASARANPLLVSQRELTKNTTSESIKSKELSDLWNSDPQKNKWGGMSERNNRKLLASVITDAHHENLFHVEIKVISTDPNEPLRGFV